MRMSTKKILGLTLAGVLTADSLTARSGGGTAATTADIKAETATAAGDAKAEGNVIADTTGADSGERKTLCVAMEHAYTPYDWTQPDDSNGTVVITNSNEFAYGHDVMMVKKICEELGYDLEIVRLDWDPLIPAVITGQADRVVAGQSITFERLQTVDFTEPYYYVTTVALVKGGSEYTDTKSVTNLAGATCTPRQSTIWYNTCLLRIQDVDIPAATVSISDMFMSLNTDKCGLVVTDRPTDKGTLIAYPNFKMIGFGGDGADFQIMDEDIDIGISLKKGNTGLRDAINSVLTKVTGDDFSRMVDEVISV